jgi:DNA repair exonuclease SbcCD ATPase subunit
MREGDEEMEDLCGEQRVDTEKTIKTLLGHNEDFLMTSLSAQGETNIFLSQGSTKRRAILTKFLDLDIFDKMHDLSSKEVSSIKSQLKNFPDRDWSLLKEQNEKTVLDHKDELQSLTDQMDESRTNLSLLNSELLKHNASPVTQADVDAQEKRVRDLQQKSETCKTISSNLKVELSSLQDKSEALQKLIDSIDVVTLKSKQDAQRKLQSVIVELKHVYDKEDTVLTQQKKSLKILDEVPCGDDYPTCKFIKDAHSNKKSLPEQSKKVSKALNLLDEANESLKKVKDDTVADKIEKHEKASQLLDKMNLEIVKKESELLRTNTTCDSTLTSLEDALKKLENLKKSIDNEEAVEVITIRSKINEITLSLKENDSKKMEIASRLGKLQSSIEKLEEEKLTRDILLQNVRMHELVSNAFSKKGIPLLVTKSQLPLINSEVSKILQGIVDFTIEMESDEDTDSLEIYINYGDSRRIIELCSGMEKTISAIALRVAMINISSLPKPDFFIIDEGFGTLDSSGVEACGRFLTSLKRYFKTVLVITHVDGIKDTADYILEITKNEKDSKVEFQ